MAASFYSSFNLSYNITHFNIKRAGNAIQRFKSRFALSSLNGTQMRSADIGKPAQHFLTEMLSFSEIGNHITNYS